MGWLSLLLGVAGRTEWKEPGVMAYCIQSLEVLERSRMGEHHAHSVCFDEIRKRDLVYRHGGQVLQRTGGKACFFQWARSSPLCAHAVYLGHLLQD